MCECGSVLIALWPGENRYLKCILIFGNISAWSTEEKIQDLENERVQRRTISAHCKGKQISETVSYLLLLCAICARMCMRTL